MTQPYPLQWPDGVARTPADKRLKSPFRTGFDAAVKNVADSLRKMQNEMGVKIDAVVLSSNCDLLNRNPLDPGACAWFRMDGQFVAFAVDRFADVAANIQAIHHIVEGRRTELRYGGLNIVRQTFKSFVALPEPAGKRPWWEVLECGADAKEVEIMRQFRKLAPSRHPDTGGSAAEMAELNIARDEAMSEIRSRRG